MSCPELRWTWTAQGYSNWDDHSPISVITMPISVITTGRYTHEAGKGEGVAFAAYFNGAIEPLVNCALLSCKPLCFMGGFMAVEAPFVVHDEVA